MTEENTDPEVEKVVEAVDEEKSDLAASEEQSEPKVGEEQTDSTLDEQETESPVAESEHPPLPISKRRSAVISPEGMRLGSTEKVRSERFDFSKPALMGEHAIERLRRMHKEMFSTLEAQMSLFLRSEVSMEFASLEIVEYSRVIKKLEEPTHMALFRADPLPGIGFMDISPQLAFTVVNQILGGKGGPPKDDRQLTKIETDLIEDFILVLIQDWFGQWQFESTPVATIVAHEVVPSSVQICDPKASTFELTFDLMIKENGGRVKIIAPLFMVEPMIRHLENQNLSKVAPSTSSRLPFWQEGYGNVPVSAEVTVSASTMKVEDFSLLKVGDVIPLPDDCMEHAVLRFENRPLFVGEFGIDNGKMALCIQRKLQS